MARNRNIKTEKEAEILMLDQKRSVD